MSCPNCGGSPELENDVGGTDMGDYFIETYECPMCGIRGKIRGTVGEPENWGKTGRLFMGER